MGKHPRPLTAAERRANLLAGLNDAPTALTGWDPVDRPAVRLRDGRLLERHRWQKVDVMWATVRSRHYADKVRTDQGERYYALTGRRLPDPHLHRTPATALERFADAVGGIMDTVGGVLAGIVVPRVKAGVLSQDDLTPGA